MSNNEEIVKDETEQCGGCTSLGISHDAQKFSCN